MKISIRLKLFLYFAVVIVLIASFQMVFNFFVAQNLYMDQKKAIVENSFYQIKDIYSADLSEVKEVIDTLKTTYGIRVKLKSETDTIYSVDDSNDSDEDLNKNASFTPKAFEVNRKNMGRNSSLLLHGKFIYNNEEILCRIHLSVEPIDGSISLFTKSSIYIALVVLLLGVFLSLIFSKNLSLPIESIDKVSKKISNLDFTTKANENVSTKELFSLAQNINLMSEELQNYINVLVEDLDRQKQFELMKRNFISSVSHEMKTPLALLQIYSENLKNNVANIDKDYYCDTILEETHKLSNMVSHMLDTSSLSSGFITVNLKKLSLTELCEKVILEYEPIFADFRFEYNLYKNVNISGDIKYVEQVLKNIINNAIQNTDPGNTIKITLVQNGDYADISIFNQGRQIADEDLELIWQAFYRADKSHEHTEYNNVGLGLYIVKTIVDKHNGKCNISNVDNGVCVNISFLINQ